MHRTIQSGRAVFGGLDYGIYSWLRDRPPGLIVDAGAADGSMTLAALHYSPSSRAIAFEPFPGNWPHLDKNLGGRENVTIVKAALSDHVGEADFYVSSTVAADTLDKNWKGRGGYSSVGRIVEKITDAAKTIRVPTTTIDAHVSEPVLFLKIDVQGHEMRVLKGATRTFERGVAAALIEYNGDPAILDFLFERGYAVYDGPYLVVPSAGDPDLSGWEIIKPGITSTGRHVVTAWPRQHAADPQEFCTQFKSVPGCFVWTDLIALAPGVSPR